MKTQRWKKWAMALAITGILIMQVGLLPVQAAEQQETDTVVETEIMEESAMETSNGLSEETAEERPTEGSEELPREVVESKQDEEGEMDIVALADVNVGTGLPDSEKEVVAQASGIIWTVDGDTIIITGESTSDSIDIESFHSVLKDVKHVKFVECKIIGSMGSFFQVSLMQDELVLESIDFSGLDTSQVTDMNYMFCGCSGLTSLDVSGFDTSQVTDMSYMFSGCSGLTSLDVSGFDTSQVTDMSYMFSGCSGLTSLDVSGFDTSQVTIMSGMFSRCSNLTSLDVSGFNTAKVERMEWMFAECDSLSSVDMRGLDTSHVKSMESMFRGCSNLTSIDVNHFDTSQATSIRNMFAGCSSLTSLDVSGFDTSQVKDIGGLFSDCSNLTSIDVSGFDTSKVVDMDAVFRGCSSLTNIDVSGFDTSQAVVMYGMFEGCSSLTSLDVSGFDTSHVCNVSGMFEGCSSLTSIDVSGFDTSHMGHMGNMFVGCSSLMSLDMSNFDLRDIDTDLDWIVESTAQMLLRSGIIVLKTPCILGEISIELPATFLNPDGRETDLLTAEFCNTTLTRKGASLPEVTPTPTPAPAVDEQARVNVSKFTERMYTVAMGRNSDPAGQEDWTSRLLAHEIDGAGIAHGFIMSEEFQNRNLSNEDFVDVLYGTFFDRAADEGGRANWLAELTAGKTRGYVLSGFVNSVEFDGLCDNYGIARGTMRENGDPCNPGIRQFVERQYTKALNRQGEKAGIDDWTNAIISGSRTPEEVAKMFFQSEEFQNRNLNNGDYVETLYETFLGRASDSAGKSDWVQQLNAGMERNTVLEGFSKSREFAEILTGFGL